jgi:4-alpha-glucanotransferase
MERAAGILLAVSSLPSKYGMGSFGEAAQEWCRFLKEAGQKYWQILPLGPTGWGNSPYQSFSAFAINPYYIDLDTLLQDGLLSAAEIEGCFRGSSPGNPRRGAQPRRSTSGKVNYAALYHHRAKILRLAFERFRPNKKFRDFCAGREAWLPDYSLFMALKEKKGGLSWLNWEEDIRFRKAAALARWRGELAEEIEYHSFVQFEAFSQWKKVKDYANSLGVSIIGDMPIYVSLDSADTWANSSLFQLDKNLKPLEV